MSSKIVLPVINDRVLIFDIEDIRKLRNLGILGILSGTLPKAPQQNIFLGVPLQLSFNETLWLIEHEYGILVDGKEVYKEQTVSSEVDVEKNAINEFIRIPNTIKPGGELSPMCLQHFISLQYSTQDELERLIQEYHTFKSIKNKGFFILPGLRFGGELIAYPGDPLRYHSHLIINTALHSINLLDVITGGRLATGVKKVWLLVGSRNEQSTGADDLVRKFTKDKEPMSFSIEWAGFG
ncbi:uncharacterized protein AC631_05762 [Debaryomyces fabryi]|uniref:tRNA-splicing endonuclease subunit Sen34 n=1 Tax=Debaryomyces fabryi TaxID=58627 RepID=A0A0V1PQW0_9ASCO|nr:uncharacterized protein AC631_05762 [Debaryomyces fabryi]KRZ98475.1 hypothetical protein AC631_05762 [Debaryomyces fabryi]CUM55298.1 unnamed protein product [Debaryomyces fabryi]